MHACLETRRLTSHIKRTCRAQTKSASSRRSINDVAHTSESCTAVPRRRSVAFFNALLRVSLTWDLHASTGTGGDRLQCPLHKRTVWHAVNREICVWPIMATRCRADGGNRHGHGPFGFLRFSDFEPFDADGCRFRACAFALAFVWVWLFPTSAHATTHKRHKPHKTYSFFRFCGRIALGPGLSGSAGQPV